jgi:hypothetical protein
MFILLLRGGDIMKAIIVGDVVVARVSDFKPDGADYTIPMINLICADPDSFDGVLAFTFKREVFGADPKDLVGKQVQLKGKIMRNMGVLKFKVEQIETLGK